MKTTLFLLTGITAIVLSTTGCTTHYRDVGADYLERPENHSRAPYHTEYAVSQNRTNGAGKASVLFWVFQFSDGKYCQINRNPRLSVLSQIAEFLSPTQKTISNAKSSALFQACEKSQADQVLGATFDYTITDYLIFSTVECTAKGFPATVKGIKMLDKQPIILNDWQKVEYLAPYEIPQVYSDPKNAVPNALLIRNK